MEFTARKFMFPCLLLTLAFSLFGCDKLADFFASFSGPQKKEASSISLPCDEKAQLLDILEHQQQIVDEIKIAGTVGDKASIRASYEEFLRLDQHYQDDYAKFENKLSGADLREISSEHYEIMKSLPSVDSMMQ